MGKYHHLDVKLTAFEEIVFWIISIEGNLRNVRVALENAMARKLFQLITSDCAHSIVMPVFVLNFFESSLMIFFCAIKQIGTRKMLV